MNLFDFNHWWIAALLFGLVIITPVLWKVLKDAERAGQNRHRSRDRLSMVPKDVYRDLCSLYVRLRFGVIAASTRNIAHGVWELLSGGEPTGIFAVFRSDGRLVGPEVIARVYSEASGGAKVLTNTDFDDAALHVWGPARDVILINGRQLQRTVGRERVTRLILKALPQQDGPSEGTSTMRRPS